MSELSMLVRTGVYMLIAVASFWSVWNVAFAAKEVPDDVPFLDVTDGADSCLASLGYETEGRAVFAAFPQSQVVVVGPPVDFAGESWALREAALPLPGLSPGLDPASAITHCIEELETGLGYAPVRSVEQPASAKVEANVLSCLADRGFGPDRVAVRVFVEGEMGQLAMQGTHNLSVEESDVLADALNDCLGAEA